MSDVCSSDLQTRVLAYVNLSTLGSVAGPGYSTLEDPRLIDEGKIEGAVEKNREMIVGIKVMAAGAALGKAGLEPLRRAQRVADNLHLPLLVHIGESWSNTAETPPVVNVDRKSTRLNSSHSLHDALPIWPGAAPARAAGGGQSAFAAAGAHRGELEQYRRDPAGRECRSEEHTSELQSLPPRRSSDLAWSRSGARSGWRTICICRCWCTSGRAGAIPPRPRRS